MNATKKVTLAYPYATEDGVEHRADSTISLPIEVANDLLYAGRARDPEKPAAKANSKKEK